MYFNNWVTFWQSKINSLLSSIKNLLLIHKENFFKFVQTKLSPEVYPWKSFNECFLQLRTINFNLIFLV